MLRGVPIPRWIRVAMAVSCLTVAAATTAKAAEQAAKPRPADPNAPQAAPLRAVFFHSSTCHKCQAVSLLESLCTAQVYLPTIVFLTRALGMRMAAVAYLLLYNVMFILPLVGILAMTYFGLRSETLGEMLRSDWRLRNSAWRDCLRGWGCWQL